MRPLTLLSSLLLSLPLAAQAAGLRGGGQEPPIVARLDAPAPAAAERVITVEAVAQVRVPPTRLRVVFAVSATGKGPGGEGPSASETGRALLRDTTNRLLSAGVAAADIDVDFIAAVPVFAWQVEKQSGKSVLVERRVGTRVQYNLHVGVLDEAAALTAIEAAIVGEGVDLLAVDYWSEALATRQAEAQEKALAAAQRKAKLLLSVFAEPPPPINVHEHTHVMFPQHLYRGLARAEDSAGSWYERELPRVPASRPLQVYYRGLFADLDVIEPKMPGRREIEVVSTVRLYFLAPARPEVQPCGR